MRFFVCLFLIKCKVEEKKKLGVLIEGEIMEGGTGEEKSGEKTEREYENALQST